MYCGYLVDDVAASNTLWILGDNFTSRSYRTHFKLNNPSDYKHYIKEWYDYSAYCNSRFTSSYENMLSHIQNALAAGLNNKINKNKPLPKYILVVLDDDLITFLNLNDSGVATLQGTWVEWLVKEFNSLIDGRMSQLPKKVKKHEVFFYWISAPTHSLFSKDRNALRIKFNLSLESVIRHQPNMRIIRLKELWDPKNMKLVVHDKLTDLGLTVYWNSIDAAFRFNETRREAFLAKKHSQQNSTSVQRSGSQESSQSTSRSKDYQSPDMFAVDPIHHFFETL